MPVTNQSSSARPWNILRPNRVKPLSMEPSVWAGTPEKQRRAWAHKEHYRELKTTADLAQVVERAVGRHGRLHPATKTFMALRMLVNRELPNLEEFLRVAPRCLVSGGRLVIISFHSGED